MTSDTGKEEHEMGTYGPSVANTVLADKRMLQKAAEATGYFANGKDSLSFMDLEVRGAAFSPDGTKVLACGGSDGSCWARCTLVRVYDVLTG